MRLTIIVEDKTVYLNNTVHSNVDANKTDDLSSLVKNIKNRTKFAQNKLKK